MSGMAVPAAVSALQDNTHIPTPVKPLSPLNTKALPAVLSHESSTATFLVRSCTISSNGVCSHSLSLVYSGGSTDQS
jgi:hypothetical protein